MHLPYLMTSSQCLSLHVVSFLPCSFSLCHRHDHSIGVGGRVIKKPMVFLVLCCFMVPWWVQSFLPHQTLFGGVPYNFRDNAVSGGGAIPKGLREIP